MGVGILNNQLKKGYLGHYISFDTTSESLVNKAVSEAKDLGDLEVALVGNIPLSKEDARINKINLDENLRSFREHRKWTLEMIKSKGISSKKIQNYLQKYHISDSYSIFIDTGKGIIEIEKEKLEEIE